MSSLEQLTKIALPKKLAVLAVVLGLIAAVYWFQFYSELSNELSSLESQYADLERRRDDAIRRKSTYDKDRHYRDELKKTYAQQLRALPTESEMSSFLASLNTQAELVGLELKSVKPQKEEAAQYYARIPVRLMLKGNFLQLAKFFYLIGNVDRIINIENISLKPDGMDDSGIQLVAEVLATTFRSVERDDAAKPKAKKG
ncbi:MAG: type 4a pilus biogenesis protein PilO [Myxococcota bacterium]|nr:type 4a pilus biogenesis protein PilO [Myxococcota bacterium]